MTPNTTSQHTHTISYSFLPGRRISSGRRASVAPRRTCAVLSVQELRQLVCQMVD